MSTGLTDDGIATAEREAAEADALVDDLETRIVDGDVTVEAEELDKARSLAGFARLRIGAARKRAARLESDRRTAALDALLPQMDALVAKRAARPRQATKLAQDVGKLIATFSSELEQEAEETSALLRSLATDAGVGVRFAGDPAPEGRIYLDASGRTLVVDGATVLDRGELQGISLDDIVERALRGLQGVSR